MEKHECSQNLHIRKSLSHDLYAFSMSFYLLNFYPLQGVIYKRLKKRQYNIKSNAVKRQKYSEEAEKPKCDVNPLKRLKVQSSGKQKKKTHKETDDCNLDDSIVSAKQTDSGMPIF